MAYIEMSASHFRQRYYHVNGVTRENISPLDVCRAAVTVGASGPLDLVAYGWRYLAMRLCQGFQSSLLVRTNDDRWEVSNVFKIMVQSEKATATYWLGMAFTKLAAERRLRVPWLCHVDRLMDQGVLTLTHGTSERGDLAGKDNYRAWHVLEAKGRSYNVSSTLVHQAKSQASRVTAINGHPPSTASVCVVRLFTSPISVELMDPAPEPHLETSWSIRESQFFPAYYAPFMQHLRKYTTKTAHIFDIDFDVAQAEQLGPDIWIGLPKQIRDNPINALEVANTLYERSTRKQTDPEISIGYDGILFSRGLRMEVS